MKTCKTCLVSKPLASFTPSKSRNKDGVLPLCRACCAQRSAAWRAAHPDKAKQVNDKQWKRRKIAGTHYDREKAKIKRIAFGQNHPGRMNIHNKKWRKANPEKARAIEHRHDARRKEASINDFTDTQWFFLKDIYRNTCAYCGNRTNRLCREHIISTKHRGNNTLSNILPSCVSCNSKKGHDKFIVPHLLRCADGIDRPVVAFVFPSMAGDSLPVASPQLPLF